MATKGCPMKRFPSIDFFRGLILLLLAAESTNLYEAAQELLPGNPILAQFFHVDWQGLHFWDLIQPGFMSIAGAALYFSTYRKLDQGKSYAQLWPEVLKRSLWLFLFGTGLHCIYRGKVVLELWNVLTQLSITSIIAFFLLRFSMPMQLAASLFLLLLSHSLYVFSNIPGYDLPYTPDQNFGSYMDMRLMGKLSGGHWIAINALPTAAHTIWGALMGRLIHRWENQQQVLRLLLGFGAMGLVLGYGLDAMGIPIIKRTSTISFVLASGGWVLWLMAGIHYLIHLKGIQAPWFKTIFAFGKNSIFIYLFFETIGPQWLNKKVGIFVHGFGEKLGLQEGGLDLINALVVWWLIAQLALFLDKKQWYFKL